MKMKQSVDRMCVYRPPTQPVQRPQRTTPLLTCLLSKVRLDLLSSSRYNAHRLSPGFSDNESVTRPVSRAPVSNQNGSSASADPYSDMPPLQSMYIFG